jgi:hypothetical protein
MGVPNSMGILYKSCLVNEWQAFLYSMNGRCTAQLYSHFSEVFDAMYDIIIKFNSDTILRKIENLNDIYMIPCILVYSTNISQSGDRDSSIWATFILTPNYTK